MDHTTNNPKSNRFFTVVYEVPDDWRPGDDIMHDPKMTAVSWSHALHDRDAALSAVEATKGQQEPVGTHHLTPLSILSTIADLREIESGSPAVPVIDRDWRTWAGVLARIIEHLAATHKAVAEGSQQADRAEDQQDAQDAALLRLVVEKGIQLHFEGRGEDDAVWVNDLMKWSDGDRLGATRALIEQEAKNLTAIDAALSSQKGAQDNV